MPQRTRNAGGRARVRGSRTVMVNNTYGAPGHLHTFLYPAGETYAMPSDLMPDGMSFRMCQDGNAVEDTISQTPAQQTKRQNETNTKWNPNDGRGMPIKDW